MVVSPAFGKSTDLWKALRSLLSFISFAITWECSAYRSYLVFQNRWRAQLTLAKLYNRKRRVILEWVQWQLIFLARRLVLEFCCLAPVSTFILVNLGFCYNSLISTKSLHIKYQNSELFL